MAFKSSVGTRAQTSAPAARSSAMRSNTSHDDDIRKRITTTQNNESANPIRSSRKSLEASDLLLKRPPGTGSNIKYGHFMNQHFYQVLSFTTIFDRIDEI